MNLFTRTALLLSASALSTAAMAQTAPAQTTPAQPVPGGVEGFTGKIGTTRADSVPAFPQTPQAPKGAPNVLLILLDDAGFAATSTFGGGARTPALDALAAQGLRYNRFHTTAICSPTRAALLTGRNHHEVGFGNLADIPAGFPAYNATWKRETASIARILQTNGYSTAAFGKWHNTPRSEISAAGPFNHWPTGLGFDHFYGFQSGEDNQWEPHLYNDTTPIEAPATPEQGYHLTTDLVNKAVGLGPGHRRLRFHAGTRRQPAPADLQQAGGRHRAPVRQRRAGRRDSRQAVPDDHGLVRRRIRHWPGSRLAGQQGHRRAPAIFAGAGRNPAPAEMIAKGAGRTWA